MPESAPRQSSHTGSVGQKCLQAATTADPTQIAAFPMLTTEELHQSRKIGCRAIWTAPGLLLVLSPDCWAAGAWRQVPVSRALLDLSPECWAAVAWRQVPVAVPRQSDSTLPAANWPAHRSHAVPRSSLRLTSIAGCLGS